MAIKTVDYAHYALPSASPITAFIEPAWFDDTHFINNPLYQLQHANTDLACLELQLLTQTFERLKQADEHQWIASYVKQLTLGSFNSASGTAFEALCFTLLQHNNQKVLPAPPGQAGFDLHVSDDEQKLHISCKKLRLSAQTFNAHNYVLTLDNTLSNDVFAAVLSVDITCCSPEYLPSNGAIKQAVKEALFGGPGLIRFAGCEVHIKMACASPQTQTKHTSKVTLLIDQKIDEQVRLEKLFRKASANISLHTSKKAKPPCNAIAIGIEPDISLQAAEQWIRGQLEHHGDKVSAVLLVQIEPVKLPIATGNNESFSDTKTQHALWVHSCVIENPFFTHPDQTFALTQLQFPTLLITAENTPLPTQKVALSPLKQNLTYMANKPIQADWTTHRFRII